MTQLAGAFQQVETHRVGLARWVERRELNNGTTIHVACASPVNVSGLLKANLWVAPVMPDEEEEAAAKEERALMEESGVEVPNEDVEMYPLTVITVSATLPSRFGREIGIEAQNKEYPSPFD